uniref:U4/U6 small nuclear ribonucleoprotein Prp31 n=1 Tax=Macrostomum lignano TaxID=282301 RepID=A0A1I8FC97_9PLAT
GRELQSELSKRDAVITLQPEILPRSGAHLYTNDPELGQGQKLRESLWTKLSKRLPGLPGSGAALIRHSELLTHSRLDSQIRHQHPVYQRDSRCTEAISSDLMAKCVEITQGSYRPDELLPCTSIMSLTEELLADLEETAAAAADAIKEEPIDSEEFNNGDGADSAAAAAAADRAVGGLAASGPVHSVAKLSDSEQLARVLEQIEAFEAGPKRRPAKFKGPYATRFPELETLVPSPVEYLQTVQQLGNEPLERSKCPWAPSGLTWLLPPSWWSPTAAATWFLPPPAGHLYECAAVRFACRRTSVARPSRLIAAKCTLAASKAAHRPIDRRRRSAAGRRHRKMKERLGMTEMRKAANRINFGDVQDDLPGGPGVSRSAISAVRPAAESRPASGAAAQRHQLNQLHGGSAAHEATCQRHRVLGLPSLRCRAWRIVNPRASERSAEEEGANAKYFEKWADEADASRSRGLGGPDCQGLSAAFQQQLEAIVEAAETAHRWTGVRPWMSRESTGSSRLSTSVKCKQISIIGIGSFRIARVTTAGVAGFRSWTFDNEQPGGSVLTCKQARCTASPLSLKVVALTRQRRSGPGAWQPARWSPRTALCKGVHPMGSAVVHEGLSCRMRSAAAMPRWPVAAGGVQRDQPSTSPYWNFMPESTSRLHQPGLEKESEQAHGGKSARMSRLPCRAAAVHGGDQQVAGSRRSSAAQLRWPPGDEVQIVAKVAGVLQPAAWRVNLPTSACCHVADF